MKMVSFLISSWSTVDYLSFESLLYHCQTKTKKWKEILNEQERGCRASETTYLRVVHVPHQTALLRVQDEVPPQELATTLILLDV